MGSLRLFLSSVRHTAPRQLAERLRLIVRRQWLERFPMTGDPRAVVDRAEIPPRAAELPGPVFPPRRSLAGGPAGAPVGHLLGQEVDLRPPIPWRRERTASWSQLQAMTLHYMEWLEGLDDGLLAAAIVDWIDANPPYRKGSFGESWNSYALSLRVVVWMQQWAAGRVSPGEPLDRKILGSLVRQLRFLERNVESDIRGNHILKNAKALLWGGRFFRGPEGDRWRAAGEAILARELGDQFLGDGMHFERSPAYHVQVTADLVECWTVLAEGPLRERVAGTLRGAAEALADLTHPDGAPSHFNDGGLHMSYPPQTILDALDRVAGMRVAPRSVFALERAGYFGARSRTYVLVDCGAIGPDGLPAHAHGDVLSFEWSVGGTRVVVDTGVVEYQPGRLRQRSRATAAHNTVTVDDADQAEFYGSFRVGRRPRVDVLRYEKRAEGFTLEGTHDGFDRLAGRPRHTRTLVAEPGRLEVEDRVEGGAGQPVRARLLFGPEFRVDAAPGGASIEGKGLRISVRTSAAVSVVEAPYWPDFGVSLPARQLVLDYGPAPCRGGFAVKLDE